MALDLSVVIPTYNGTERIPAVLDRLKQQNTPASISWEVLVVDNNSDDHIAELISDYQHSWLEHVPLRYMLESRQGTAYARQCGVENTSGNFIGFIDDDNWPVESWVAKAVEFGRHMPKAGAFGSRVIGAFEQEPDETVKPLLTFLAVRDIGKSPKQFYPSKLQLPAGAGLVVRRDAWMESIPSVLKNISRPGEDYEISVRLAKKGWEIWYNPEMQVEHFIPANRLERTYLLKLAHLYGACTCNLLMLQNPEWKKSYVLGKAFLGSLRRILAHQIRYPWYEHQNLEAECQLAFHMGNLKSPILYLLNRFDRLAREFP
ncbi:MAG: hormogonium polysaccharide biosynthesis glycosyltransferase HpsE [Cyanobacteria bacterium P01_D01_bin.156]